MKEHIRENAYPADTDMLFLQKTGLPKGKVQKKRKKLTNVCLYVCMYVGRQLWKKRKNFSFYMEYV